MRHLNTPRRQYALWAALGGAWVLVLAGILPAAHAAFDAAPPVTLLVQDATPVPRGNTLFTDDFATQSHRWAESASPKAVAAYRDETLMLSVVSPGVALWSLPDFAIEHPHYRVEVSAQVNGGSPDSALGIVVGYTDDADFYVFALALDGTWRLLQRDKTRWIDLTPSDAVQPALVGSVSAVRLAVEVVSGELTLWVGDEVLGTVTLDPLPAGLRFGVLALAGHGYVDVAFDDVVVTDIVVRGAES